MVLTEKQRQELHAAIFDYFRSEGLKDSLAAFQTEAKVDASQIEKKHEGLLEKKWTSVVRLQKKVMDLEAQVSEQQEAQKAPMKLGGPKDMTSWIPRPPFRHELAGHRMAVTSVIFHPFYTIVATASEDATIKLFDYETGGLERTLKGHTNAVHDIAFSTDGALLASCSADTVVKLWSLEGYENIKSMHGHDHSVTSVTFTPDSNYLVSASRDKTIKVWEISSGYCVKTLTGHSDWVRKARVSHDGSLIASVSSDQTVRVWAFSSGECKLQLRDHDHVVESVNWAPPNSTAVMHAMATGEAAGTAPAEGLYFATSSRDKTVRVWDAVSGTCLHAFVGHDSWVGCVVWHPGGKYLLSGSDDRTIRVWDLAAKRQYKSMEAHGHFVSCVSMHPTSPFAVSGSVDHTARVWDCR